MSGNDFSFGFQGSDCLFQDSEFPSGIQQPLVKSVSNMRGKDYDTAEYQGHLCAAQGLVHQSHSKCCSKNHLMLRIKSGLGASQSMWPDPCTNPQTCPSPYPRPSRTFPVLDWYHVFLPQPGPQVHSSVMVGTHILAHNWSLIEGSYPRG